MVLKIRFIPIIATVMLIALLNNNILSSYELYNVSEPTKSQEKDPFNNDDNETQDPFNNDDNETQDPFNNDDNETQDPNDLFGEDDGESFIPIPDLSIGGYVGLAVSSLFLNHNNELVQKIDDPKKRYRYLACDVYGNAYIDYKFFSMHVFGSFDVLGTIDTSGVPKFKIDVRELYLSYVNNFTVIKLGHLLVEWSTMDIFSLTNYFNPFSDTIYSKQFLEGVNGVHAQFYFAGNMSAELVFVPLFTNSALSTTRFNVLLGGSSNITSIDIGSLIDKLVAEDGILGGFVETESGLIKIFNLDTSTPSLSLLNTQLGLRYGVKFGGIDLYLSYYHGYDKKPMFSYTHTKPNLEEIEDIPGIDDVTKAVKVDLKREYSIIDSFGISSTFNVWKITFNAEITTTINDPIMFERETTVNGETFIDRAIETSPTLNINFGLRWELAKNWLLLMEFSEFVIFKGITPIEHTRDGGSIFTALAYTLESEPVNTRFTQAIYFDYRDLNLITVSYVNMDFKMGLYCEIGVGYMNDIKAAIDKEDTTEGVFGLFNRSVIMAINVYYEF